MNVSRWQGTRVLITGHTGFKGAWLTLWLTALGARVSGFALSPSTSPALFDILGLGPEINDFRGDVSDREGLCRFLESVQPDVVFHFAAQALVRESYREPVRTFATNVLGTVHLLDAIKNSSSVRAVILATSDKCYRNDESGVGFREGDPLGGSDPYSGSKAAAELAAHSWRISFPTTPCALTATVRAGNVIGGGDWSQDRIIPDLVRGFLDSRPAVLRHPEAVRPWQHVLDPLFGYLKLAEAIMSSGTAYASAWNFGPSADSHYTVGALAAHAANRWGKGASWVHQDGPQLPEAHTLRLDSSQARTRLGWKPRWDMLRAVEETIDWYRAYADGAGMRDFSLAQIKRYMEDHDE